MAIRKKQFKHVIRKAQPTIRRNKYENKVWLTLLSPIYQDHLSWINVSSSNLRLIKMETRVSDENFVIEDLSETPKTENKVKKVFINISHFVK